MSIDTNQVRHIAKLARIAMSDAEIDALVPELNNILGWVEQLGEVDTDGVEPLAAVIPATLAFRDDVVNDGDMREAVLANAPVALALCIESVDAGYGLPFDEAQRFEANAFGLAAATQDMAEGTAAFLAKRAPQFTGR